MRKKLEFILQELSGSFGDIGTDLPILIGLISTGLIEPHSVFILFGLSQILTGTLYKLPMPVQPLKYMAILMMAQNTSAPVLFAGGFMIAVLMLLLNVSGLLNTLKNFIPSLVIRGIQLGLALSLIKLSATKFFPNYTRPDIIFAIFLFVIGAITFHRKKIPTALILVVLSCVYATFTHFNPQLVYMTFKIPNFDISFKHHLWDGLVLLAIPQLALSLSNSVFATEQMIKDHFPDRPVSLKKIGYTYSLMNLISPFFGGIPVCHGAGGIAGHFALGGRTGLSVIFYGLLYLTLGLFFSGTIFETIKIFPLPLLGVILLFEAYAIYKITYQHVHTKKDLALYIGIACICAFVPNGFLWGLIIGIIAAKIMQKCETSNKVSH